VQLRSDNADPGPRASLLQRYRPFEGLGLKPVAATCSTRRCGTFRR